MIRILIAILSVAIACAAAKAQQITAEQQQACFGDHQNFCPGVIPGGGRIIACLRKVEDKVSAPCRAVLRAVDHKQ